MGVRQSLCFVSCANKKYYRFVVPFLYSCLSACDEESVIAEVFLEDLQEFESLYRQGIDFLKARFGCRFRLTEVGFEGLIPNTVRFVNTPSVRSDYVYIVDVDIFYTQGGVLEAHLKKMTESGQSFSNIVRKGSNRLSGLHFTAWDALYPLPGFDDLDLLSTNDEVVLYRLVARKTGQEPRRDLSYRPIFGIHMSPNRPMLRADGSGVHRRINPLKAWQFLEIVGRDEWNVLFSAMDSEQKELFAELGKECVYARYPFLSPKDRAGRGAEKYDSEFAARLRSEKKHDQYLSYLLRWHSSLQDDHLFLIQLSDAAKKMRRYSDALIYLAESMQVKTTKRSLNKLGKLLSLCQNEFG